MPDSLPPSVAERTFSRERRVAEEIYWRTLDGPPFLALGCLVLGWSAGPQTWYVLPAPLWLAVLIFLISWPLRRLHRLPADDAGLPRWQRLRWLQVHGSALVYCAVLLVYGSLDGSDATVTLTAVVSMLAFASAAAAMMFPVPTSALSFMALLVLPPLWPLSQQSGTRAAALTVGLYTAYLSVMALRNARAFRVQLDTEQALLASRAEIERLTREDSLTGLANRRDHVQHLEQAWAQAQRHVEPLALLLLDIDHFKAINDHHGHLAGDACLQHFSNLLRQHFRRAQDHLARIGGEEFVVLMPDTSLDEARVMAERFRAAVEAEVCEFEGRRLPFTVSLGLAVCNPLELGAVENARRLLARADAACYAAKRAGRNRLELG
ncbi:diguanylate cyclase (GGDEF)-like protein [Inhella inkyongensis]|uniref:diguanylate cyclase n=1 Tax=Inhella inkyongensis TaxID=392593 RepID=A0A840S3C4_9BURK|nr:GGDEF domain-containing protein [Inhella inkyongensis]MBB5203070.1 diguanylate cyclase (GGDEF)-like protein [Inhella inkyongensis]